MKREIKFRFWVKEAYKHDDHEEIKYKMVYPHDYKDHWYVLDLQKQVLMEGEGGSISDFPMEVMQFTGLKDKNGKEIYEGDIINFKSKYSDVFQITIMRFGSYLHKNQGGYDHINCLGFYLECPSTLESCFVDDDLFDSDLEIIGNIYENPELLNDGVK